MQIMIYQYFWDVGRKHEEIRYNSLDDPVLLGDLACHSNFKIGDMD